MSSTRTDTAEDLSRPAARRGWRVVDIVVAAVLGVAMGFVFYAWNGPGYALYEWANAITPGLGGLANGLWFLGAVLGGAIIRKPGAALLVEVFAAMVSAAMGNIWGWSTVWIGIAQGIGAELVLALVLYRRWNAGILTLAGAACGVGAWVYEFVTGNNHKSAAFNLTYLVTNALSGAVLAGLLGWALTRALAGTGAQDRFASGRQAR